MIDTFIEFETAKLAKDAGFNETTRYCWVVGDEDLYITGEQAHNEHPDKCAAPTQALLQKWLREEHDIFVTVDAFVKDEFVVKACLFGKDEWGFETYPTYEDALEGGLKKGLRIIKEEK